MLLEIAFQRNTSIISSCEPSILRKLPVHNRTPSKRIGALEEEMTLELDSRYQMHLRKNQLLITYNAPSRQKINPS
jgi:hypothetical protein